MVPHGILCTNETSQMTNEQRTRQSGFCILIAYKLCESLNIDIFLKAIPTQGAMLLSPQQTSLHLAPIDMYK